MGFVTEVVLLLPKTNGFWAGFCANKKLEQSNEKKKTGRSFKIVCLLIDIILQKKHQYALFANFLKNLLYYRW